MPPMSAELWAALILVAFTTLGQLALSRRANGHSKAAPVAVTPALSEGDEQRLSDCKDTCQAAQAMGHDAIMMATAIKSQLEEHLHESQRNVTRIDGAIAAQGRRIDDLMRKR